ncbi:uncharacterized protein [Antedon mediterranea]|uniref:uncharacterized protein n=1 Tax=Antedon mediterranea TaxID=105859 RepID=UPI003AF9757F
MSFSSFPSPLIGETLHTLLPEENQTIIAKAMGSLVCQKLKNKLYDEDFNSCVNYWKNVTWRFIINTNPSVEPLNMCWRLHTVLYNLELHMRYIISRHLINTIYLLKKSEPHDNSSMFEAKSVYKTFQIESGFVEELEQEIDMCVKKALPPDKHYNNINNTFYKNIFHEELDTRFDYLYTYVYDLFSTTLGDVINGQNSNSEIVKNYIQNNYGRVNIYFDTLRVEELTDQPRYELFSLICDFGGSLGLFFGASVVAIFETIEFWCIRRCGSRVHNEK